MIALRRPVAGYSARLIRQTAGLSRRRTPAVRGLYFATARRSAGLSNHYAAGISLGSRLVGTRVLPAIYCRHGDRLEPRAAPVSARRCDINHCPCDRPLHCSITGHSAAGRTGPLLRAKKNNNHNNNRN